MTACVIREALPADLDAVLAVERLTFGADEEADLVRDLLEDGSAKPTLSLIAVHEEQTVGHVLFSKALLEPATSLSAVILAPLAVVPDAQKRGIGGKIIAEGLRSLAERGVDLVFVLGHPGYYPNHGFRPAGRLGFDTPYPILEKNAGAWMLHALRPTAVGTARGRVVCADMLMDPKYWRE